ncbi:hypothetical protein Poli38472_013360 [Pythium oligandrum]|uniref:Uncharacterized protein n=1 Tax=Pythium oligandrum TaxID=41045 RepID=A0A8K1FD30_PYTOL|nr:hypothetical protein Poli38472_013360 [Pythium oligandrum]|eukprot:TMW57886.1 hypothetical protein Poli38472_013360 [Pythium oligandrum]
MRMANATDWRACDITDGAPSCYTASWYLIWDQLRYYGLCQLPIVALSIIYEWLELSNDARLERLRTLFDAPLIVVVNVVLQVVTCIYVCIAWVVRGGSLAVTFSSWSVESFLLIATAVGYAVRWMAAKHKVRYTLRLNSLFDLLSLISHFTISFQTYPVDGRERRSWLDFGFLRSYILYVVIDSLFTRFKHKTFVAQVGLVMFKAICLVFFAACVLFSLERLGDLPYTNSFLLHVYKCTDDTGGKYILVNNVTGTEQYPNCSETWSFFSSIYFMFVTVSTVGYGDFSPKTVLGQVMVCIIIVVGIYTFANESAALFSIYGDQRNGRVRYNPSRNTAHVIVTGNPSATQIKDFFREFFHPDHDDMFSSLSGDQSCGSSGDGKTMLRHRSFAKSMSKRDPEDMEEGYSADIQRPAQAAESGLAAKWMQRRGANRVRETHIVILMTFDTEASDDGGMSFFEEVTQFVNENPRYHHRVFIIYGSPLKAKDLRQAKLRQAMGVFFLPNKFSSDGNREDAATVLRVLSVSQQIADQSHLFAMLVNSENKTLLEATGLKSDNLVCADELRLGLMGLSCRCPGLSTLVSNLITSRSADFPTDQAQAESVAPWLREYITGAANEIYSCTLAGYLHGMTFTQCTQRIHKHSLGQVLMIAVEYQKQMHFNPGHRFRIKPGCRAFMIAESVAALEPFSSTRSGESGATSLVSSTIVARAQHKLLVRARRAQHTVERRLPEHVRDYVRRCGGSIASFDMPQHPPPALVANGGHIVVCSNVANDGAGSRSISRLVSFLRPLRAPHVERVVPVVIVDSEVFDSVSWLQLSELGQVYHVVGSPQRHQVLLSAGVYSASAVVVLAQGTATGYDDSKAIFNAILVNSALERSEIFTIIELRDVHNNKFLDSVKSFGPRGSPDLGEIVQASPAGSYRPSRHRGMSTTSHLSVGSRARNSSAAKKVTYWGHQVRLARRAAFYVREFFWGSLQTAALHVHDMNSDQNASTESVDYQLGSDDDTFFQERFMRGALFPSSVADDLLIQSFFNPSLNQFIRMILDGTSCFMLYDLPHQWRRRSATYGEIFDHMTSGIAAALPIGLLRAGGGLNEAPHPYVYTSPPSHTLVHPGDKIFAIIDVHSIHRIANKIQRRFRSRKQGRSDPGSIPEAAEMAHGVSIGTSYL